MRNFNFLIPGPLDRRLKAESDRTGVKLSEIARRAIDEYLERRASDEIPRRPRKAERIER